MRTIRYIPHPGEHQLSINLELANAATVFELAKEIGVKLELVQIPTRLGVEIQALLLCEQAERSPLEDVASELSQKLDELAASIDPDAIRHVYGRIVTA